MLTLCGLPTQLSFPRGDILACTHMNLTQIILSPEEKEGGKERGREVGLLRNLLEILICLMYAAVTNPLYKVLYECSVCFSSCYYEMCCYS